MEQRVAYAFADGGERAAELREVNSDSLWSPPLAARSMQATELSLNPTERRSTLPGPAYRGGDPAWAGYAERIGIQVIGDDDP